MAKRRPIPVDAWHGMVLVDKPIGMTSQQLVSRVKRQTNSQRAGHTGTLDPLATGLLPVCLNEGTKFAGYLLTQDKSYLATLQLGCVTDTGDLEGSVLNTHEGELPSETDIKAILPRFVGEQDQVPPRYSALKLDGRKYYEYAREGIEIERPSRRITIFSIQYIEYAAPYLTLEVHCSSGTYIRTLAEDIGTMLGCGATLSALRRTCIGSWHVNQAVAVESLTVPDKTADHPSTLPCEKMVSHLPRHVLSATDTEHLYQGRSLTLASDFPEVNGLHRLFRDMMGGETFIGLGDIEAGQLTTRRLIAYNCL